MPTFPYVDGEGQHQQQLIGPAEEQNLRNMRQEGTIGISMYRIFSILQRNFVIFSVYSLLLENLAFLLRNINFLFVNCLNNHF